MHLFLFTKTAQRELVSICTQRISNRNSLFLLYYLGFRCVLTLKFPQGINFNFANVKREIKVLQNFMKNVDLPVANLVAAVYSVYL